MALAAQSASIGCHSKSEAKHTRHLAQASVVPVPYSTRFVLSCICLFANWCSFSNIVFRVNFPSYFLFGLAVFRFSELDFLCVLAPTRPYCMSTIWKAWPRVSWYQSQPLRRAETVLWPLGLGPGLDG
jgi:hypothetical protein